MSHRIEIEGSDLAFDCAAGQSVLDAALRAGIELPYSCRQGVCGNCAGGIADGAVQPCTAAPLRNETCLPGQVLYCACTPVSDLRLAPTRWKRLDPGARRTFMVKVHANELAAPDVSVLRLRLPIGQRVRFTAGQYLRVRLDDGSARCYSMANPPHENDGVTLHVRHVPGGLFSGKVAGLQPGDTLAIELPFGHVNLPPDDPRPIVFVAGGTGFAPIKSILDDMARRQVQREITLIRGAREASGLYLPQAIEKWRKQWPGMRYIPALSESPVAIPIRVFAGRVDEALRAHCPDLTGQVIYACGSPAMVQAVRGVALDKGAAPIDIHADAFVPGPVSPG